MGEDYFKKHTKMVAPGTVRRRAGAELPDDVGSGGKAVNVKPTDFAKPKVRQAEENIDTGMALNNFFKVNEWNNPDIKSIQQELLYLGQYKLSTLINLFRNKYRDSELVDGSFASSLVNKIKETIINWGYELEFCNLYPVGLLKNKGYKGMIDVVVDIKFKTNNKYDDAIFFSLEVKNSKSGQVVNHHYLIAGGVDFSIFIEDNQEDLINELAVGIVQKGVDKYTQLFGPLVEKTVQSEKSTPKRVVRF